MDFVAGFAVYCFDLNAKLILADQLLTIASYSIET